MVLYAERFDFMNWFTRLFSRSNGQPAHSADCCKTDELADFIQKFVTEESLEPVVHALASQHSKGGCGCDDSDNVEITILDNVKQLPCLQQSIPQLKVLLIGHKAYCGELEQMMRSGKTTEFDLEAVGEGLMCCIGKWLQCEGKVLRDYAEYNELMVAYENFQVCAENMLENHKTGHFIEAVHALKYEFVQTSGRVQQALLNLVAAILDEQPALQAV